MGMNAPRSRKSGLEKLLGLLNQPHHDYRPATEVFLDLDIDRIADDLDLPHHGQARGAKERPAEDAQTLDDIEHQIVERAESHKQAANSIYVEHLHTYDARLAALNFEERFAIIQQAAPEAVGEFGAEAALGRDELFGLRRHLYDCEQERDLFRARHKIQRPARISSPGKTILKVGILAALFLIEVVVNGSFLARSNLEGLLGGAVQAVSFAALNIIASFLFGLVPIRLLNRRNFFLKFIGLLGLLIYLAFAVGLNLTLAHLREIPPSVSGEVGQEVLNRLLTAPHILNDVNSWVFFGVGFAFSLVAMVDGLLFTDPYFGYGSLEKRCREAHSEYTNKKEELFDRLRAIKEEVTRAMNNAAHDLSVRRGEFDSILHARARLAQRFVEHQNHIERSCRSLLVTYREANRQARQTPAPSHFGKPYNIERIPPAGPGASETTREQLRESIAETQGLLKEQAQKIHSAYEDAVRSYTEIDVLIPENTRASTASKAA